MPDFVKKIKLDGTYVSSREASNYGGTVNYYSDGLFAGFIAGKYGESMKGHRRLIVGAYWGDEDGLAYVKFPVHDEQVPVFGSGCKSSSYTGDPKSQEIEAEYFGGWVFRPELVIVSPIEHAICLDKKELGVDDLGGFSASAFKHLYCRRDYLGEWEDISIENKQMFKFELS